MGFPPWASRGSVIHVFLVRLNVYVGHWLVEPILDLTKSMEKSLETCNSRVLLTSLNILYYEQWTLWRVMKNQWKNKRGLSSRESSIQLTLRRTRKFIPPSWYKGGGGWNPSPEFLIFVSISKRFYLWWKTFDLLNKMRYILWVMPLLEACDVTNNGRHLVRLDFTKN